MDISKLKTTDWLVGGGAIVFFISMFLPWYKFDPCREFGASGLGCASVTQKGFDYWLGGIIPLLLVLAVLAILVLPTLIDGMNIPDPIGPLSQKQAALAASGVAAVLVLLRLIIASDNVGGFDTNFKGSRGFGLILALIAAIAVFVGSLMKSQGTEDFKSIQMPNAGDFGAGGGGGGPQQPPQQF